MIIRSIESLTIRIPANWGDAATGGDAGRVDAGDPGYALETVLARVTTDTGLEGWGESQALSAPEAAGAIIQSVLKPALEGAPFQGSGVEIETLWDDMYNRARLCGQAGGFMLDAIAAVDIALWDLAGRIHGAPVAALIAGPAAKTTLETYVNRLPGETAEDQLESVRQFMETGCRRFAITLNGSRRELLERYNALASLCGGSNVAVDAQFRLDRTYAAAFATELDRAGALWLGRPFPPGEPAPHAALAARMRTPVALGETYRTRFELAPFFEAKAMDIVQPDVGRCGITESLRIARAAGRAGVRVAPHLSASLGPLLYATLQFAAAVPNCLLAPYAPSLIEIANAYSVQPLAFREGRYVAPCAPGLGIELKEQELRRLQVG